MLVWCRYQRGRTLCEEVGIAVDQLAAHRGCGEFAQSLALVVLLGVDGNLLDLVDGHGARPPQALDDGLAADSLLDVLLDLLQNLSGQHNDRRGSVSDLSVLRAGNVGEDAGGGVDNVEQLHDGGAVVGDGLSAILVDQQQVTAVGAERALDGRLHRETCIDV